MDSGADPVLRVQLVTPEEPTSSGRGKLSDEPQREVADEDETHLGDATFFMPSVKNTRDLETEILGTIQSLQTGEKVESDQLIAVLNRSITAISHWSLQAQLAQLRGNVDDRQAVETNLLRREMEFLIQKRPAAAEDQTNQLREPIQGSLRTPPYTKTCESPRRPAKKLQPLVLPVEQDPLALTLVENKKPHPRMRRTSDNPSTNEYVRVFHLRRK